MMMLMLCCATPFSSAGDALTMMSKSNETPTPPPPVPTPAQTGDSVISNKEERTDQNDRFSLQVKKEYVLNSRATSLPPLAVEDLRNESAKDGKKKKKGMNKKRPRDARIEASDKVCMAILRSDSCPYGDNCRFSHDLKKFMADRPDDIKEVEGGCPIYNLYGYCGFGAMCRLGSSHINTATGENKRRDPQAPEAAKDVVNVLPKDVQIQLRKKRYPFKCKRHNEKKEAKANSKQEHQSGTMEEQTPSTCDVSVSKADHSAEVPPASLSKAKEVATDAVKLDESKQDGIIDMSPLPTKRKIIDFSNKVYIAPLTTLGNLPFRRVMKRLGADITCGEMALCSNLLDGKPSEWALLKRHREEDIFGVQIAAGYPDQFTRACEVIEAQMEVDFVDLNLGCPLDMVCNKGSGAALMMRDKRLKASLEGITKTLSCPVTVKMRTGWDINKPFAHNLAPKIQSWGIDGIGAIMVHGRSRLQRYSKEADWDYISKVACSQESEVPVIPVIGNGDIFSYTEYEQKVAKKGVSSCAMLARGALIKPWLPTEIKERRHWDISASERLDILKDFVKFGLEHWGTDQQGVNNCRRFLLEWLSFLYRYVPVGMLDVVPQEMNQRPPKYMCGRSDLETLFLSDNPSDWIRISEMLLGSVPDGFRFEPKHKAKSYKIEG